MQKFSTALVLFSLLFASCQQEDFDVSDPATTEDAIFTANTESFEDQTKTALNSKLSIIWALDDALSIFEGCTLASKYQVSSRYESNTSASFTKIPEENGSIGSDFMAGTEMNFGTNIAVYPYESDLVCNSIYNDNKLESYQIRNVTVPAVQSYAYRSFPDDAFTMVALTQGLIDRSLKFKNVSGALKLRLKGKVTVKSIEITGNDGELLSGDAVVSVYPDGRSPQIAMMSNASQTITLDCGDGVKLYEDVATAFIMAVPPTDFRNGFTVVIHDINGNRHEISTMMHNQIRRSRMLSMPECSINDGFTDEPAREEILTGIIIGTKESVDYETFEMSTTVNTKENVFDGDFNTFFASYDRSGTWVGLDLGEKHVITKIGYSPRIEQGVRVQLAVIEGANTPDFSDALPIHMIKNSAEEGMMHYEEVNCSRGFRYVRYVTPNDKRCNLAELEFYGVQGEGDDSHLYQISNLPTVVINTENAQEIVSKEEEISSNVYIISEEGKNLLSTSETGVRGRGNASWDFPKKPYRLKFSSKQSPLGAPASAKKWTLISNYGDKTLMRNILAFEVSRRVGQSYTPYCHLVDLVVNGEYRGCYQLCDQVEAAKGRVDAKDGYLIEVDAYASGEEVYFYSNYSTPVTIKHPDEDDITSEQRSFITDFYNKMENAVLYGNLSDETNGYRKYLDLDSFLRNFIIGEFGGNTDTYWSVYMYKDSSDGKLFTGPAWDYDLGFDNDYRTYPINNLNEFICLSNGSVASEAIRSVVRIIVKEDTNAKRRLIELWENALENGKLDQLNKYVDETAELLQESQELNFKRWDILNEYTHMNPEARGSYDAEVQAVKDYITGRLTKFDQLIRR